MLFQATNNKRVINGFDILVEVIIGFGVFVLFFIVFMNYIFTDYQTSLLGKFIQNSLEFYKPIMPSQLKNLLTSQLNINKIEQDSKANHDKVNEFNKPYDNKLILISLSMLGGLIVLAIIPVILGIVPLSHINLKFIGISLLLHLILIIGFEVVFIIGVLPFINTVKIYKLLDKYKQPDGTYKLALQ